MIDRTQPRSATMARIRPFALLIAAACAGDTAARTSYTERDSAGVTIVENRMDTASARLGWSIDPTPLLTIGDGDPDGDPPLYQVSGALRLSDGRIAAVDALSAHLRIFAADGTLLATYGRKGEGPGEFAQPVLAGRLEGDSLVVFDAGLRRASVLTADHGFVRSYTVGTEGGGFPLAQGVLRDGSLAVGGGMYFSSADGFPNGMIRAPSRYIVIGGDGTVRADIGEFPAAELYAKSDGGSFTARPVPFGRVTGYTATADVVWLGTGDAWELRSYSPAGRLQRIARIDRPAIAVTGALREAAIEEKVAEESDVNQARAVRALMAEATIPSTAPHYEVFRADAAGNVWVGEFLMPGEHARTWTLLDPSGRVAGRITTPARTLPTDIGNDYLLGVTSDELGVERLTLWRLSRPR